MNISEAGIALIKEFEGLRLEAYKDIVGVPTIGYGHTGPEVHKGMVITQFEADDLLRNDLAKFEECVTNMLEREVTQSRFDALCAFAYNLGCTALAGSTLLRLLNSGQSEAASQQFLRWNKAGGQVVAGLTRRREAEKELFLS